MRKIILGTKDLLLALLAITIVIIATMFCGWTEQHYTKTATVVETNEFNDVVVFVDEQGFEWECEATNLKEGQKVSLLMNNNKTENDIFDDKIVGIKISN